MHQTEQTPELPTAYRGEPNPAPPPEQTEWYKDPGQRQLRREYLLRQGPQCGEYLRQMDLYARHTAKPRSQGARHYATAQGMIWPSMANPLVIFHILAMLGWFSAFIGLLSEVTLYFSDRSIDYSLSGDGLKGVLAFIVLPATIGLVFTILKVVFPQLGNLNNVVFRRRDGCVHTPSKLSKEPIPFADFDPFLFRNFRGTGATGMRLMLCHRTKPLCLRSLDEEVSNIAHVWIKWEELQHYMDIRWPMPDTPECEPYRGEEAVTADWDQRRERPPYWWRNISLDQFMALQDASSKAANAYPWGKTREEAKAEGWQPSIYSQVLFEEASYEDLMQFLAEADPKNAENIRAPEPSPET